MPALTTTTSHTSSRSQNNDNLSARTPLLHHTNSNHSYHRPCCQQEECEHGTLSPHASRRNSSSSVNPPQSNSNYDAYTPVRMSRNFQANETQNVNAGDHGGRYAGQRDLQHSLLGDAGAEGLLGDGTGGDGAADEGDGSGERGKLRGAVEGTSTTQWLAKRYGVRGRRIMYLAYYFPFLNWITQYRWSYFQGDLVAALTMASFYIPMSLSYAANLGHIPPINGLYSFVFNPLIYALLGSCPQMVVGPEAAGSLLVGSVVRGSVDRGDIWDDDDVMNATVAGVVTGMAGAVIFVAGLTRLGFLDSVLSRPFLRGFISAIGFVILVDQLIPEMGLSRRSKHDPGGVNHGSSVQKLVFLIQNAKYAHGLTSGVAFGSFAIILVCRYVRTR